MRSTPLALLLATLVATAMVACTGHSLVLGIEQEGPWQSLFDGKTFAGWRGYRNEPITGWEVRDGTLHAIAKTTGVPLVTEKTFTDFELSWEWKLPFAGNNGVKYFVTEDRPSAPGHEYQMLDDANHPDGKIGPHRQTGAFYDVLPPAADKPSKPIGEWNASRILVRGNHVEHWLNGRQVLAYELGSPEVKAGLAKSKFAKEPGFGDKIAGRLMLTYHSDDCWFRNLKVRELK
jgi:Domain of Unknown Function (DUF1080)